MKNNFLYVFALFLLSAKLTGQTTTDTVFIYETIVVYDTIKVYDTLKVEDKKMVNSEATQNYFKNNFNLQNAVLAIDTATQKAELIVFSKNDTATISINSIILSETNKNLETMKKQILTLAAAALLTQTIFAQVALESKPVTDVPEKKMVLGAGVTNYDLSPKSWGANLKFDYLLNNKFGIGVKTILGSVNWEDYTAHNPMMNYGFTIDYKPGNAINLMFTSTYYLLGKNGNKSKGGVYTTFGLGYSASKHSFAATSLAPQSDSLYYKYSTKVEDKTFSGMISIGGDRKLGPGRIYFETAYTLGIYGTESTKWTNHPNVINDDYKYTNFLPGYNNLSVNLGYSIYF